MSERIDIIVIFGVFLAVIGVIVLLAEILSKIDENRRK